MAMKSLRLAAHILNSPDIFFSVFGMIFLTSQSYYKVYLKNTESIEKPSCPALLTSPFTWAVSLGLYLIKSLFKTYLWFVYAPTFISQMDYTDLARGLAHLTPTTLLECDNNYVFFKHFFKAENTQS